jgi:hypothetical protein
VQGDGCGCCHQLNPINIEVGSAIAEHFNCVRLRGVWRRPVSTSSEGDPGSEPIYTHIQPDRIWKRE